MNIDPPDPRLETASILIPFSAGVESTAVLNYAVSKYGNKEVVTIATVIHDEHGIYPEDEVQLYFARQSALFYGVPLLEIHHHMPIHLKRMPGWGIMVWMPDCLLTVLANPNIKHVWYGLNQYENSKPGVNPRVALQRRYFFDGLKAFERVCELEPPLKHLPKWEQYINIPEPVKKWVWTCDFPSKNDKKVYVACGECGKCKEFEFFVTKPLNHV